MSSSNNSKRLIPRNEEYDWIFDYVLQFLESDKFDASVMDFIDEKCFVFVDEEENKFIYTEIHKEFCDHVESLITTNLVEFGITNELFLESCEKAKDGRDINTTVFERLTAMDDFQTFKKIMTKRNTELQLESIRTFKGAALSKNIMDMTFYREDGKEVDFGTLLSPAEIRAINDEDLNNFDSIDDEDIQDMLMQSLMSMEFIHRQEELEHAELERALMLSLAIEEERLRQLLADAKLEASIETNDNVRQHNTKERADSKHVDHKAFDTGDRVKSYESNRTAKIEPHITVDTISTDHNNSSSSNDTNTNSHTAVINDNLSDTKPALRMLPLKPLSSIKALPSIHGSTVPLGKIGSTPLAALGEKKKQAEEVLKRSQEQLSENRKKEEQMREKIISNVDPEEVERRALHMRKQRELLLAKKKAEREEKVQAEEERQAKKFAMDNEVLADSVQRLIQQKSLHNNKDEKDDDNDDMNELRRASLRNALARRMKMDLLDSEDAKLSQMQDSQFAELDKRLQQVEQQREDNRKREYILNKQMERQQAQIARNIRLSAKELKDRENDV